MQIIGRLSENRALEFAERYPSVKLGSKSASGLRRLRTNATGRELFVLRDALAMFDPAAIQAVISVPVLSPGIRDPIPCVPCVQSHDQEWADHPGTIAEHMLILKSFVDGRESLPDPQDASQDGIVYVGGGRYWPGIVVGIRMLRSTGCQLPVQVWHRAEEPVRPSDVEGLNVELINSTLHAAKHGGARILGGWEQKLWAIAHCGLRRILYLDADAYVVANPTALIESLEIGAPFQFWKDQAGMDSNVKWEKVWKSGSNGVPAIQGGQLLIDIPRAWRAVVVAHWMNQHSDFFYKHLFGDQDIWRVAFAALNDPSLWLCLGNAPWVHPAFVIPVGSEPMIVHRCRSKLFPMEAIPDLLRKRHPHTQPYAHLPRESEVFAFLADVLDDDKASYPSSGDVFAAISETETAQGD